VVGVVIYARLLFFFYSHKCGMTFKSSHFSDKNGTRVLPISLFIYIYKIKFKE
jgi:hypothetical protein